MECMISMDSEPVTEIETQTETQTRTFTDPEPAAEPQVVKDSEPTVDPKEPMTETEPKVANETEVASGFADSPEAEPVAEPTTEPTTVVKESEDVDDVESKDSKDEEPSKDSEPSKDKESSKDPESSTDTQIPEPACPAPPEDLPPSIDADEPPPLLESKSSIDSKPPLDSKVSDLKLADSKGSNNPPSYNATLTKGIGKDKAAYRLYLYYRVDCVQCDVSKKTNALFSTTNKVNLFTQGTPFDVSIRPMSEPVRDVMKNTDMCKVFPVIIEGPDYVYLHELSKVYTSYEYWKSFAYIEKDMNLYHVYNKKSLKKTPKPNSKDSKDALTLNIKSYTIKYSMHYEFQGGANNDTDFTLHIKFKKADMCSECANENDGKWRNFNFKGAPTVSIILEKEEVLQFHQNLYFTGETIEFLIKDNDFDSIINLRNTFMGIDLPTQKYPCTEYKMKVATNCLESAKDATDKAKYIISLGERKHSMIPHLISDSE